MGRPADRPPLLSVVRRMRAVRGAVLHPGWSHRPAAAVGDRRPIPYIDQVALDFPELVIVCGHVGYPWTEEMVAVARKHENVYIDTSAYTIKRLPGKLVRFMKTDTGQRKVLFGTNYPMIAHTHALTGLDELGLSDEARRDFLHGNAVRVFKLDPRGKVQT